jgi:hypothetical protein
MKISPQHWLSVCIVLAAPLSADAGQVFQCTVNGKVMLTNTPCANSAPVGSSVQDSAPPAVDAKGYRSTDYSTLYGEWRGQTQFQASAKGHQIPEAHAVVPMTIYVDGQGKVVGESPENGCRLLGIASPISPTVLKLDTTLSSCQYAGYNRRYSGTLGLYQKNRHVQLSLTAMEIRFGHNGAYELKATMKR